MFLKADLSSGHTLTDKICNRTGADIATGVVDLQQTTLAEPSIILSHTLWNV